MNITRSKQTYILNAIAVSVCCIIFAYCINGSFYFQVAAFTALLVIAFCIARNISSIVSFFPADILSTKNILLYIISAQLGFAAALYYRYTYGMFILPASIHLFVLVAIAIAIAEELLFRGFMQSQLQHINPTLAIILTALAHALYKATIFLSPFAEQKINVTSLFIQSFIAYIILGYLKRHSKSVIPPVIAHVVFDIIVYAEIIKAPWWVW